MSISKEFFVCCVFVPLLDIFLKDYDFSDFFSFVPQFFLSRANSILAFQHICKLKVQVIKYTLSIIVQYSGPYIMDMETK